VERQQRVLHRILDLLVRAQVTPGDRPRERQDRLEESAIGLGVTALRGGEQRAPFGLAGIAVRGRSPGSSRGSLWFGGGTVGKR
jgi:hypothetical protein